MNNYIKINLKDIKCVSIDYKINSQIDYYAITHLKDVELSFRINSDIAHKIYKKYKKYIEVNK